MTSLPQLKNAKKYAKIDPKGYQKSSKIVV